jgi:endonuclease YncB( thermonuclease family)
MSRLRSGAVLRFSRRRRRRYVVGVETLLVAVVAAAIVGLLLQSGVGARVLRTALPAQSAIQPVSAVLPLPSSRITVIDGDTIRIAGEPRAVRLVGFNAPETRDPKCASEAALGSRAKARVKELVRRGNVTLAMVPCACRPGTEGTDRCNFGRSCGTLAVDGRDVGSVLIAENLAAPFRCGVHSCPRLPRPWCDQSGSAL